MFLKRSSLNKRIWYYNNKKIITRKKSKSQKNKQNIKISKLKQINFIDLKQKLYKISFTLMTQFKREKVNHHQIKQDLKEENYNYKLMRGEERLILEHI